MSYVISSNATLHDVVGTHFNIDQFVALVFDTMRKAKKEHGPVVIRLGVTGAGKLPNFRLDAVSGAWKSAFDGVTRQPFDPGDNEVNWSTEVMHFNDVEALLRKLRNYTK